MTGSIIGNLTRSKLNEAIRHLRHAKTDLTHIEVKAAATDLPKRLWETISAFSNTPQGGTLLLGLSEEANFAVTGVDNPKKVLQDLASLCSAMDPPVRAHIELHQFHGKTLVAAQIPELEPARKPCYLPSAGLTNGAFIRVADGDRKLSHYEVHMMLSTRGQPKDDEEPVPYTSIEDFRVRLVSGLITRLRRPGSSLEHLSDEKILQRAKALVPLRKRWVCSLAGLLSLGEQPQRFFPAFGLTVVVYPGANPGEPGPNQERFLDNERIVGPIPDMLTPTLQVLQRNMKQRSIVKGLYREDVQEYPITAVREGVINSLVHRDFSAGSRGSPVQIKMYSNRLTVFNPGGLFGPVTVDSLGREGVSSSRNDTLLRLLEDITPVGEPRAVCENRGSGMGAMVAALRQAGLPAPDFDDQVSSFRISFFNSAVEKPIPARERTRKDRRDDILALLRERGELSRGEISQTLALSEPATRKWLSILREERKIGLISGAKARSRFVRYQLVDP